MKKAMLLAVLVAVLVAGCDNKPAIPPMPEVNDTNSLLKFAAMITPTASGSSGRARLLPV